MKNTTQHTVHSKKLVKTGRKCTTPQILVPQHRPHALRQTIRHKNQSRRNIFEENQLGKEVILDCDTWLDDIMMNGGRLIVSLSHRISLISVVMPSQPETYIPTHENSPTHSYTHTYKVTDSHNQTIRETATQTQTDRDTAIDHHRDTQQTQSPRQTDTETYRERQRQTHRHSQIHSHTPQSR